MAQLKEPASSGAGSSFTPESQKTRSMSIQNLLADDSTQIHASPSGKCHKQFKSPTFTHRPATAPPTSIPLPPIMDPTPYHNEDDVQAAMALDGLRQAGSGQSTPSFTTSSSTTFAPPSEYSTSPSADHFMSRVSSIPFVNSALKAYENTKANSRVVKYGAEALESSVKSISKPVITKFNPQLGQLDDLACKTLNLIEKRYPGMNGTPTEEHDTAMSYAELEDLHRRSSDAQMMQTGPLSPATSSSRQLGHQMSPTASEFSVDGTSGAVTTAGPRNRWHNMLMEAGTTAGGLSAAVSEESMKSLKYCLQWLQYATAHIDQQILMLRDTIASLNAQQGDRTVITQTAATNLANIKKEVIETIRKVVEVVSRYAGATLPEPARRTVRNFILTLPSRWASLNRAPAEGAQGPLPPSASTVATEEAAKRILSLAMESLDMIRGVTTIVGDTLERAEVWVERLRVVGVNQRRGNQAQITMGELQPNTTRKSSRSSSISSATSNGSRKRIRSKYLKDSNGHGVPNGGSLNMEPAEDESSNSESEYAGKNDPRMEMHADMRRRKTPKGMEVDA